MAGRPRGKGATVSIADPDLLLAPAAVAPSRVRDAATLPVPSAPGFAVLGAEEGPAPGGLLRGLLFAVPLSLLCWGLLVAAARALF